MNHLALPAERFRALADELLHVGADPDDVTRALLAETTARLKATRAASTAMIVVGTDPLELSRALVAEGAARLAIACGRDGAADILAGLAERLREGPR